jgi:hypothetical protein
MGLKNQFGPKAVLWVEGTTLFIDVLLIRLEQEFPFGFAPCFALKWLDGLCLFWDYLELVYHICVLL